MSKIKVHPLRAWRTSQGFTQTEMASILGYLSPGIIHSVETYKLDPKISEVKKLCDLSEGALEPWDFLPLDYYIKDKYKTSMETENESTQNTQKDSET